MTAVSFLSTQAEYGVVTLPFPVPSSDYDYTLTLLDCLSIGQAMSQDCRVDEISSGYPILNRLAAQNVDLDELDFVGANFISKISQVNELGFVAYHGSLTLDALMGSPHEPSRRRVMWEEEPQRNKRALPAGQNKRYEACGGEMREDPAGQHQQEPQIGGILK